VDSSKIKYPIYIVSKGRWENPLTAKFLLKENIPFKMVVEPQEYDSYLTTIPKNNLLQLPFSNLGLGSYPARNFCWEHSLLNGHKKHFLFDDNIYGFRRLNRGQRPRCPAIDALVCLQDFTERFEHVAISGYNYSYFVTKTTAKPFTINTHVYSGMLINNEIPFRWRLKYNEDVDLCLQALHNKWSTILLNVFLIEKVSTTVKMKGGNQTELYKNNDEQKKMLKSRSLELVWPQYVRVVERFGRPHHQVSWLKFFKHPLRKINGKEKPILENS